MGSAAIKLVFVIYIFSVFSGQAWGWGRTGHRTIGEIAQLNLSQSTLNKIEKVLDPGESLAIASVWADTVKSDPSRDFHGNWHNAVASGDVYNEKEDLQTTDDHDVVTAISFVADILRDQKQHPQINKKQALRLLIHFVGDVHQPLHVPNYLDEKKSLYIRFFNEISILHKVWDTLMINWYNLSYSELAQDLNVRMKHNVHLQESWLTKTPAQWAQESLDMQYRVYHLDKEPLDHSTADPSAFNAFQRIQQEYPQALKRPPSRYPELLMGAEEVAWKETVLTFPLLEYNYVYYSWPLIEYRLYQAGMRLAVLLENIFSSVIISDI